MTTLVTHSGSFHADDITAYAVLAFVFPGAKLIRTRDEDVIAQGDIVFDVGRIYNPNKNRFDHHQAHGPKRPNMQLYSSAGLIWKHYGRHAVRNIADTTEENVEIIWKAVDQSLISYIDLVDNGVGTPGGDNISVLLAQFNPTWEEQLESGNAEGLLLENFLIAAGVVKKMIVRLVKRELGRLNAKDKVLECVRASSDPRILELPTGMPWQEVVFANMLPTLFVLHPNSEGNSIMINTVPQSLNSFTSRMLLPDIWAAKDNAELAAVTGVEDAVFCHKARFVAAARSWEGAREMVRQALLDGRLA